MVATGATAPLIEVFASIQGEGTHVGVPTLFVRAAVCPLRCTYCDTVDSYEERASFEVRAMDGSRIAELASPIDADGLVERIPDALWAGVAWVSFTGGEPLLYPEFGRRLFTLAKERGVATHLETAAVTPPALVPLLDRLDHLSMDWKLPSTLRGADTQSRHLECLQLAVAADVDTAVKVVLTPGVTETEWLAALASLAPHRQAFQLVLQPVTPCLDESEPTASDVLASRLSAATERGFRAVLVPQVHKLLGLA